jgi:hypothetical protein
VIAKRILHGNLNISKNNVIYYTFWLTWSRNGTILSVEGFRTFFFGADQMDVLDAMDFGFLSCSQFQEIQQVQYVQDFLDKCLAQDSSQAEFMQSLGDLACYKHETIPFIVEKLSSVSQLLSNFVEFEISIHTQLSDLVTFISKNLTPEKLASPTKKLSISFKYFQAYVSQFIDTVVDRNLFLASFIKDFWDYIPEIVQSLIIKFVTSLSSPESVDINVDIPELKHKLQAYASSVDSLKQILSPAFIETASLVPKISISTFKVDNLQKDTALSCQYVPLITNKGYTLDTLLQKVAPDEQKVEH